MSRLPVIVAICACLFVAACSGQQTVPSRASLPGSTLSVGRQQLLPAGIAPIPEATKTPLWGVGVAGKLELFDTATTIQYFFCQQTEPQGSGCPMDDFGKSTYSYTVSKSQSSATYETSSAVSASGTEKLGTETYSSKASASTKGFYGANASARSDFNWTDSLTVKSSTLPQGSPVTFSVSVALTPTTTAVRCDRDGYSGGFIAVSGPGRDSFGDPVGVAGSCMNGSFVYTLGNAAASQPRGTTDVGTATFYVGKPVSIGSNEDEAETDATACDSYCSGSSYSAGLAGSAKWRITGIPPGVTYTTASGNTYR